MKKIILGVIIGLFISSGVVFAANYLYKANEVSYTPKDNTWNVDSVDKAINDLYNITKNYIPKPSGTKTITTNGSDIDVTNFEKVNVNVSNSGGGTFKLKTIVNYGTPAGALQYSGLEIGHTYIIYGYNPSKLQGITNIQAINGSQVFCVASNTTIKGYGNGDDIALGSTIGYIFEVVQE